MHYTKDLSATVLFLVLKKASRLERIVGAESWHDMDPRWDAVQTYEIHSNSRLFSAFATRWMQFLKRDSFVTDLYHLTTMIMNIFIKNLCCIFLFSFILSISHVTVTNHIDRPNLNFDITRLYSVKIWFSENAFFMLFFTERAFIVIRHTLKLVMKFAFDLKKPRK